LPHQDPWWGQKKNSACAVLISNMQTAKAASSVARIAEHIIALWHSKVSTFWSHRVEKRLIDENIENKILMRLCCNGVVLLRLTGRGRAGRPKNSAKKSKVPAPVNRDVPSKFHIKFARQVALARGKQILGPHPLRCGGSEIVGVCLIGARAV